MTFKSVARRGIALGLAGFAAAALSACGAGQISQTANQVAAVDGAGGQSSDNTVAVRDVTVIVNDDATAALKFTAINQDPSLTEHSLQSVTVGGEDVTLSAKPTLAHQCSVVADSKDAVAKLTEPKDICITHISTTVNNDGFAPGGNKDVTFNFDTSSVTVSATVTGPLRESGHVDRTVAPDAHGSHNSHGSAGSHAGHSH